MRFGDVLPETRGTPLGNVVLGEENTDFFVFGDYEKESGSAEGDGGKTVVLFKTQDRHPVNKAVSKAGAPIRFVKTSVYTVFAKMADLLTFWKPKRERANEAPAPETHRPAAPDPMGTPDYLPVAMVGSSKAEKPASPAADPDPESAEPVLAEPAGASDPAKPTTETLNWAGPVEPEEVNGNALQDNQTGGWNRR